MNALSVAMRMQWLEQPLIFACREVPTQCGDEFGFIAEMGQIIGFGDEHDTRQAELQLAMTAKCP